MNTLKKSVSYNVLRVWVCGRLWVVALLLLAGCANIVSPTGGPKDTSPPQVEVASPPSGSTRFSEQSFSLRFNEFIQTGNLQQQLLISPPLSKTPTIKLKGKTLIISFSDTLRPDATYAFFFGEAIKDITEGNLMQPYTYFFATGDSIDDHVLRGKVLNALDGKVAENMLVMLYALPMNDSAVALEFPRYITRPDKSGLFEFKHLAVGEYHLVALSDLNNNMQYDLITEGIAFRSQSVTPWIEQPKTTSVNDSLDSDTVIIELDLNDTLVIKETNDSIEYAVISDSAVAASHIISPPVPSFPEIVLRMFVGEDSIQKVLSARSEGRNKAVMAMRYPLKDPKVTLLPPFADSMVRWDVNVSGDTVFFWMSPHNNDTLGLVVGSLDGFSDTIYIQLRQPPASPRGKPQAPGLTMLMNVPRDGKLKPNAQPLVIFPIPLKYLDVSEAILSTSDTTYPLQLIPADSMLLREFRVVNTLTPGTRYTLTIPPMACLAWDGTPQPDTLRWSFTPEAADQFGTLTVVPEIDSLRTGSILLMLTDDKMRVLETRLLEAPFTTQKFEFLNPGQYSLRAVDDRNGNGRWDTGDYWKRIQPEEIVVLPSPATVRANWEEEIVWELRFSGSPDTP